MKIGRLVLRLTVGGLFVGHGMQKLLGWFGGPGLDATAENFHKMGMRPGRRNALAASLGETAGGAALALGLATPIAAGTLTATMLTAINRVHFKNGPWNANGGYEFNLTLIAAVIALAETGPGEPSLDHALGQERCGSGWALAALALGGAGAAGAHLLARREARQEQTVQQQPAAMPAPEQTSEAEPAGVA